MILTEYDEQEERDYQRAEGRAEGRELGLVEGRAEGRELGRVENMLSMIQKKYAKGKSQAQIADELDEDVEVIRPLYDLVKKYPDKTAEELSELYVK